MKKITLIKMLPFYVMLLVPILTMAQIGEIIWEDNFDTFNTSVWTPDVGDGCAIGLCGWGNQELQSYEVDNVSIESIPGEAGNNALVLEARNESSGSRAFTSGKVVSDGKLSVQYGLIEIRMRVPDLNTGLWPAAWMLGTTSVGWPAKGEIDIMEMGHAAAERDRQGHAGVNMNNYTGANAIFANEDGSVGSIAFDVGYNQPYVASTSMANRFVTYRLYWEPTQMRYTVIDNGTEYDLYTAPLPLNPDGVTGAFTKPFYFLLNLAVGGNFTDAATNNQVTAALDAKVYIDYVRVHKWNGFGSIETDYNNLVAENGTFGVFTETTPTQNELVFGSDGEIYVWGGTMQEGSEAAIEGNEVISWETLGANVWFGGGVANLFGKDMSNYVENGSLKFKIKIPANVPFRIGITDNFTNESWLTFNANESKYGLVRNGDWGEVEIPLEDFAGLIAFQNINYMFAISSDPAAFPTTTFALAIDDIVWEDGNTSIPVTGVSISPGVSTLDFDDTVQLTATITPAAASNQNRTWSSSNTSVATVNSSGLVTAVNSGNATITVTTLEGSFTATTAITVNEIISNANLALGKAATQSTTSFNGSAGRAVDGNTSGIWNQGSITHTAAGVGQSWEVDLGGTFAVGDIAIWNRTNCCSSRLNNITVSVEDGSNNTLWSENITSSSATTLNANAGGVSGRVIKITQNQNQPLSLAEVEVYEFDGTPPTTTFVPDPSKFYYIDVPVHNLRIGATGEAEDPYTTSTGTTGAEVAWKFVAKGNGSWHIQLASGSKPRLRSRNNGKADMQATSSSGSWTYYDITPGSSPGSYFLTLPDINSNTFQRLQVDNSGDINFVPETSNGTWESFTFTEVSGNTEGTNLFIEAEDYATMSGVQLENTSDTNGGQNVGYIDANDWMEYTVNIPSTGTYTMNFRVASAPGNASATISANGASVGTFNVDATGGWQSWITVSEQVNLAAGNQNIRLTSTGSGWNINWLEITGASTSLKATIANVDGSTENELTETGKFLVYPVPANGQLNIALDDYARYGDIRITDILGRSISSDVRVEGSITTIDVSQLESGMYLLNIFDRNNKIALSRKLVIE